MNTKLNFFVNTKFCYSHHKWSLWLKASLKWGEKSFVHEAPAAQPSCLLFWQVYTYYWLSILTNLSGRMLKYLFLSGLSDNHNRLHLVGFKLRQIGPPNQIVDDMKLDSNKFGWQLYDDSDSMVEIVSSIAISINFCSLSD